MRIAGNMVALVVVVAVLMLLDSSGSSVAAAAAAFVPNGVGVATKGVSYSRQLVQPQGQQPPWSLERRRLFMSETKQQSEQQPQQQQQQDEKEQIISINDVTEELKQVQADFQEKLAAAMTVAEAEQLRRDYLGKKGPVNKVMGYMRVLSADDKPKLGVVVNEIKDALDRLMAERKSTLEMEEIQRQMESEKIDITMPGVDRHPDIGRRHPLSMVMEKAIDIFTALGYDTVTSVDDSPEVETDYYCFEALNCPKDHPARDMQDTFYLTEDRELLLRTHTSSVQIRQLEKRKPPLRIVAPGRVYRRDDIDATHSLIFHQVEILALEKRGELNLGHLKGTVEYFLKNMFGPNIPIRFRGSYFPFTEPSMEVDVFFRGKWLEVLGCGMVDPNVLEMAGVDPEEYSGFAAGFGVERFAMVIHDIKDIREFYKNDKRFLQQFPHHYDEAMPMFLKGEMEEEEIDPRGEEPPWPPVDSLEELVQRNLQAQQAVVKGGNDAATTAEQQQRQEGEEDKAITTAEATPKSKEVEKKVEKKTPAPSSSDNEINISKLDIRVGVITKAWYHEEADKLYCEEIDIGEEAPRQIASGLRAHYSLEELQGQRVLVLANLKARKLVGFPSHGMVLCATAGDAVKFVEPPADAAIGERVMVEGYDGEPATENQVLKKKMLEEIFPHLKTNSNGVATYKGIPLTTRAGPCTAPLANADIA